MKQLNLYYLGGGAGPNVPDGKTVTPINDVQIWQQCAGLIPTYTTLAEVLNDSGYVRALMNSDNAVDYMVRSTDWATEQALVPTMTSNTTPEGVAFASAEGGTQPAYRAFDNNTSTDAVVGDASGEGYIGYQFTSSTIVGGCYVDASVNNRLQSYKLQGSNDGSSWTDITDTITVPSTYISSAHFSNTVAYDYIRLYQVTKSTNNVGYYTIQFYSASIPTSETAMQYIGANDYAANELLGNVTWREAVCDSEYFENVLCTKVPVMTSNTAPRGVASASSVYNDGATYQPWKAFDGDDSSTASFVSKQLGNQWLEYCFDAAVTAYKVQWIGQNGNNGRNPSGYLQASNDGTTYTPIKEINWRSAQTATDIFTVDMPYRRYRVYNTSSTAEYLACQTFQIYGRDNGGVQTWLKSAGITDKTYTTLSQVLNDTTTLAALMNSTNAVNYLVTATSWASTICADQNAMNYIGLSNYASNTLLANDTWRTAICNSTYFESVLNVKVPTMTSNTTPSGICSGMYAISGDPYMSFDGNDGSGWRGTTGHYGDVYVAYAFPEDVAIYKSIAYTYNIYAGNRTYAHRYKAQNSDQSATDWISDAISISYSSNQNVWTTALFDGSVKYQKYMFYFTSGGSDQQTPQVNTLQFYGRADV